MAKYLILLTICSFIYVNPCFSEDKITVDTLLKNPPSSAAKASVVPDVKTDDNSHAKSPAVQDMSKIQAAKSDTAAAAQPEVKKSQPAAQSLPQTPAPAETKPVSQKSQPAPQPSQPNTTEAAVSALPAAPAPAVVSTGTLTKEEFIKQMNDLQDLRRKLTLDIYRMRIKMIKDNPELRVLQRTIVGLHEKMAKQLNSDPKIQNLMNKAEDVDKKMISLINSQQVKK